METHDLIHQLESDIREAEASRTTALVHGLDAQWEKGYIKGLKAALVRVKNN